MKLKGVLVTWREKKNQIKPVSLQLKVVNVVEQCQADERENNLLRLFNEQIVSDSVVQYLRLLTSAHLQIYADFFRNFVEAPDLQVYCRQVSKVLLPSSNNIGLFTGCNVI